MAIAVGVAAVWALGAWWSFTEQRAFAHAKGFSDPSLLPMVIDGFAVAVAVAVAVATACVAFAASLDGRPAVPARIGTAVAVAASAVSNGWWAADAGPTMGTRPGHYRHGRLRAGVRGHRVRGATHPRR
jgi:hypothetical protein